MLGVSRIGLSTFTTSMGATKRCAHNEVNGAAFVGAFVWSQLRKVSREAFKHMPEPVRANYLY